MRLVVRLVVRASSTGCVVEHVLWHFTALWNTCFVRETALWNPLCFAARVGLI
jgi:hypothetical protein